MIVPSLRLQHALTGAILVIPLLALIILCTPAWLAWPFLPADRQTTVLNFLDRLVSWITAITTIS